MTSNMKRTVLVAIIALSLALIACADTRSKGENPAGAPASAPSGLDRTAAVPAASGENPSAPGTADPGSPATGQAAPSNQAAGNARLTED